MEALLHLALIYPPLFPFAFVLLPALEEGGQGDDGDGRSKFNNWEACYSVGLASYLLLQGIPPGAFINPLPIDLCLWLPMFIN
jgi:hypothetical protein